MAASNRAALIDKTYKVLKKHFKPVAPNSNRALLEQLLFACCLENSRHEAAEEAYARLSTTFFDWNEVRVTTVKELAETMHMLADPAEAAERVKKSLQSVFESTYSFDLEHLKKQNIGQAIQKLEKYSGVTPFAVAYVTQTSLGGHAIPLSRGSLQALAIVGIATPAEERSGSIGGLERAIPKNKGPEFASLLHQLGANLFASPFSPAVHKVLLEINAESKERLPKRAAKKKAPEVEVEPPAKGVAAASKDGKEATKKAGSKKRAEVKTAAAKAGLPAAKKKASKVLAKPKPR
jgi:endonuclease-3